MSDSDDATDIDIESELRGLFEQAEQDLESRAAATLKASSTPVPAVRADERPASAPAATSIPEMLRPVVKGIEALTRATGENTALLNKMGSAGADLSAKDLLEAVTELKALSDQKSKLNEKMFDALHEELRVYKDEFVLEAMHRPVIRDLIALYDEVTEIHRQSGAALEEAANCPDSTGNSPLLAERVKTLQSNLEHNLHFVLEVLARVDVHPMPNGVGKLDKRTQKAVLVEPTNDPEEDAQVIRSIKRGFVWKTRVVRPEEVITKKWKESLLPS